jgi:hypothetical protein
MDVSPALGNNAEPVEPEPAAPIARLELAPQLAPLPTPEPEPVMETPVIETTANHAPISSEEARTHKIGPPTIEFRPIVDPDTDDPDDFAGAV